jgi:hypothetical protein
LWAPRYLWGQEKDCLTYGGDMFYLTDETHLGGMSIKWQNGTDRSIDRSTDRQTKKGPRRPSPLGRGVKIK